MISWLTLIDTRQCFKQFIIVSDKQKWSRNGRLAELDKSVAIFSDSQATLKAINSGCIDSKLVGIV